MRVHPCPHLHPPFFPTSASQSLARSSQRLSCYLRAVHCPRTQQGNNARTHTQPITHGRRITFSPSPPPPFFLSLLAQSAPSNNNQESRDVVGMSPFHKPLRSPHAPCPHPSFPSLPFFSPLSIARASTPILSCATHTTWRRHTPQRRTDRSRLRFFLAAPSPSFRWVDVYSASVFFFFLPLPADEDPTSPSERRLG